MSTNTEDENQPTEQPVLIDSNSLLSDADKRFLYGLLPDWVKEVPLGLDPTMYGTLTRDGDIAIKERVDNLLNR